MTSKHAIKVLSKRRDWLTRRIEENETDSVQMSFDREERSALKLAINSIEQLSRERLSADERKA